MTPDLFDEIMDLIDHKIATQAKHGTLKTALLRSKQGRLRERLQKDQGEVINSGTPSIQIASLTKLLQKVNEQLEVLPNKSEPENPADPRAELQSDILKARLVTLREHRINLMMSDDQAFSNGRLREIDRDISELEMQIQVARVQGSVSP